MGINLIFLALTLYSLLTNYVFQSNLIFSLITFTIIIIQFIIANFIIL